MRLKGLLLFLLISIALGAGGWLLVRELFIRKTLSLDEAWHQIGTTSDGGDTSTRVFLDTTVLASLQDPFFAKPCYFGVVETCLLEPVKGGQDVFIFRSALGTKAVLNPGQVSFAVGQMVGSYDQVRAHFAKQKKEQAYFEFVKQVRDQSLENRLNPALVYAFYDFVLGQTTQQIPVNTLPSPEQVSSHLSTGLSIFEANDLHDTTERELQSLPWTPHGKALLYAATWSFPDSELIKAVFSEAGAFDHFYTERFFGQWANKPFRVALHSTPLSFPEYFQASSEGEELVTCYRGNSVICSLETIPDREFWELRCRPADFLIPLCGDLLLNL